MTANIHERTREKFLKEILEMYAKGEVSVGKAAEMLGIPRAALYQLLAEKRVPLPEKLNRSVLKELKKLETKKDWFVRKESL